MQRCTAPLEPWRNATCLSWSQVSRRQGVRSPRTSPPRDVSASVHLDGGLIGFTEANETSNSLCCGWQTVFHELGYKHCRGRPGHFGINIHAFSFSFPFLLFYKHCLFSVVFQIPFTLQSLWFSPILTKSYQFLLYC